MYFSIVQQISFILFLNIIFSSSERHNVRTADVLPTSRPTIFVGTPSFHPTYVPTRAPTAVPTAVPTAIPTAIPTHVPTAVPSAVPTPVPSAVPTAVPSHVPTAVPTAAPSAAPTAVPSATPTAAPSAVPTTVPSDVPTVVPSHLPTAIPTEVPTVVPTAVPSATPSETPSAIPTEVPSAEPTYVPSAVPSAVPTEVPTEIPTVVPTEIPSAVPTADPTADPTAVPSEIPTYVPTAVPTYVPTRRPTKVPTHCPTSQPTVIPSSMPSSQPISHPTSKPTSQPISHPTSQPSSQPSAHPSKQPTSQPTRQPTRQPTSQPTSQPTRQPNAHPTKQPTSQPTTQPSRQPSSRPSSQPSSQPTSSPTSRPTTNPTDMPSDFPTEPPTAAPTADPTSRPSTEPSGRPSLVPSSQPSSQPSSCPTSIPTTSRPTSIPTSKPTKRPNSAPTSRPTSEPSSTPSAQPSSFPSEMPSSQPTTQPSSLPSSEPTRQPTSLPTSQPSSFPSTSPSSRPTRLPTGQPSSKPSQRPTTQPTGQPSSAPSKADSARTFPCGKQLVCESGSMQDCSFYSANVTFKCVSMNPCVFHVGSFSLGPNTHAIVEGGCQLAVIASNGISIYNDSSIKGPNLYFQSPKRILVEGHLITDYLGAGGDGAGSPSVSDQGIGGSYGGNGGRPLCGNVTYVNSYTQVGSVRVYPDFVYQYDTINPAIGSGGGPDSYGGGVIVLNSTTSVVVTKRGSISCKGSPAPGPNVGAGSGGSVVIATANFTCSGSVSVNGGNSAYASSGAGGGGRVSVTIFGRVALTSTFLRGLFYGSITGVSYDGGIYVGPQLSTGLDRCLYGAPGTLYVQFLYVTASEPGLSASITVRNSRGANFQPYAATVLSNLPPSVGRVYVTDYSTLVTKSLILEENKTCKRSSKSLQALCSNIVVTNSTIIYADVTSVNDAPEDGNTGLTRADAITFVNSRLETSNNTPSTIYCKNFTLLSPSSIVLSSSLTINSTDIVHLYGPVKENAVFAGNNISFGVYTTVNISLSNVEVSQVIMSAKNIYGYNVSLMAMSGKINPGYTFVFNQSYCNVTTYIPNTIVLNAQRSLILSNGSLVHGSGIALCGHDVNIAKGTVVRTDGMGLSAGQGVGAGGSFPNSGGGGGGFGGSGGTGQAAVPTGGRSYGMLSRTAYGSGGGCYNNVTWVCQQGGQGGGYINVKAINVNLHGNLTSNGNSGVSDAGGGSGGYVSMLFKSINGDGFIFARGGNGGSGLFPGGGGGGGYISLVTYSAIKASSTLTFEGSIAATGGSPGQYQALGVQAGVLPASAGSAGPVLLPDCDPGFGNSATQGRICVACDVGLFSPGGSGPCMPCTNKPPHAIYTQSAWYNGNCPYQCENGYTTDQCYDPFQEFLYDKIGLSGFIGSCIGFFALILLPLVYYRYKKYNDWEDKEKRNLDIFGKAFFYDTYEDGMGGKSRRRDPGQPAVSIDSMFSAENPMFHHTSKPGDEFNEHGESKWMKIRPITHKSGKDGRREIRMVDQDMIFHAYRMNLMGSNEPFSSRGGAWHLPLRRPDCLKPTLLAAQYYQFAKEINRLLEWKLFSVEMLSYYLVLFLTPPLGSYYMRQLRHRRTQRLLNFISSYDHACFRCPIQRRLKNSLRVGISPDSTLAYIDVLFDEAHFTKSCKPLCPLGQTKLPAAFKFAGLGTYSTPYYIDTNDLLLQAVSQTDVASAFIDEAWITFVYNLNIHLRTLQCDAIYMGARSLMKFLEDPLNTKDLGGLVVQFCTFENECDDTTVEEKLVGARSKKEQRRRTIQQAAAQDMQGPLAAAGDPHQPTGHGDDLVRDSFVDVMRPSRATKENWFHHVGDILHIPPVMISQKTSSKTDLRESTAVEITMSELGSVHSSSNAETTTSPDANKNIASGRSAPATPSSLATMDSATGSAMKGTATDGTGEMPIRAPTPPPDSFVSMCGSLWERFFACLLAYGCCCWSWCFTAVSTTATVATSIAKPRDQESLQSMDFIETCEAIRSGRLSMGILVYHPKVVAETYIIQPEDYVSDLEDDDVLDETILGDGRDDSDEESSFAEMKDDRSRSRRRDASIDSTGDGDDDDEEFSPSRRVNFGTTTIASSTANVDLSMSGTSSSMLRNYGAKAEEMAKFYRIMMEAETGQLPVEKSGSMSSVSVGGGMLSPGSSMSISMKNPSFSEQLSPSVFPFPMVSSSRTTSFSGQFVPPSSTTVAVTTPMANRPLPPISSPTSSAFKAVDSSSAVAAPPLSSEKRSPDRVAGGKSAATAAAPAKATAVTDAEGYTEFISRRRLKSIFPTRSFADDEDDETEVEDRLNVRDDQGYDTENKDGPTATPSSTTTSATKPPVAFSRTYSVFNPQGSFDSNDDSGRHGRHDSRDPIDGESKADAEDDGDNENNESNKRRVKSQRASRRILQEVMNGEYSLHDDSLIIGEDDLSTMPAETRQRPSRSLEEAYSQRFSEISESQTGRDTFTSETGAIRGRSKSYNERKFIARAQAKAARSVRKSATDLQQEHTTQLRRLRRQRRKQAQALTGRSDLAPSCFQHPVRAWVYSNIKLQGAFSSGRLGITDEADAVAAAATAAIATATRDVEQGLTTPASNGDGKAAVVIRTTFDVSHDLDGEEDDDDSRRRSISTSSRKKRHSRSTFASTDDSPFESQMSDRFRDSILPASFFSRMTFSGRGTHTQEDEDDEETGTSDRKSLAGGRSHRPKSIRTIFGSYTSSTPATGASTSGHKSSGKRSGGSSGGAGGGSGSNRTASGKRRPGNAESGSSRSRAATSGNAATPVMSSSSNSQATTSTPFTPSDKKLGAASGAVTPSSSTAHGTGEPTFWTDLMESLRARWRLAYINNFYVFFFTRFMVGYNIFPYGPTYVRRLIELPLFLLSLSDCILWVLILSTSLCVSNDVTKCSDHRAFNLMISLWPGAFILAPISGMIAIVLGPSSTLARIYAMFSRLAGINNLVLIAVVIQFSSYYLSIDQFSIWPVVALTSGRLFQTFMVDLYIAHIEKLRYTRGWDGLHTSLFKTRDNKVVINS